MTEPAIKLRRTESRRTAARTSPAALLKTDDAFATTMLALAADAFGPECFQWTRSTLEDELCRKFGSAPSRSSLDRLMAAILVQTTNFFWRRTKTFVDIANVLGGARFDPTVVDPVTVAEAGWAVMEATLIHPHDDDPDEQPDEELVAFLEHLCRHEGYSVPPKVLTTVGVRGLSDSTHRAAGRQRADELDKLLADEMHELLDQLAGLSLEHGNASAAVAKLMG